VTIKERERISLGATTVGLTLSGFVRRAVRRASVMHTTSSTSRVEEPALAIGRLDDEAEFRESLQVLFHVVTVNAELLCAVGDAHAVLAL